jgi:subtilisin-like proprotein convertase family protein/REP element-mobilizing transposase RayT
MNRQYSSKTAVRILCALFVLIMVASVSAAPASSAQAQTPVPQGEGVTDTWAVQISPGTDPDQLALQMGAQNLGQIGSLTNYYLFRIPGSASEATAMADVFAASSQVVSFEQQVARQQNKRVITDPVYLDQWHLASANVEPAWNAGFTGTGVTIAVVDDGLQHTHPDLSAQYVPALSYDFNDGDSDPEDSLGHLDYHGTASAGTAAADNNGNIDPRSCGVGVAYDSGLSGLRLIAAPVTDAQEAAALNFGMNPASPGADFNSIYSNSWGPAGNMTEPLAGPGPLTLAALRNGVTTGRGGKGSIYVWAAGNGLLFKDNVNYDGYANSRYTIAVGAVDDLGEQASYSEPGAAMLVTAPSGSEFRPGIVTTDLLGNWGYSFDTDCTEGNFGGTTTGGTSASAPLVSGVVALMLDANPNLGWRDVQNILARTAVQNDPTDTETIPDPIDPVNAPPITVSTWVTNGAGLHVNHKYGFGLVDAGAAVAMANPATYVNLLRPVSLPSGIIPVNLEVPDLNADPFGDGVVSEFVVTRNITLEHVEVVFNASDIPCTDIRPVNCGGFRGDLKVVLTSPSGVQSVLSEWHDDPENDYVGWKFMTIRNWGEMSAGIWTLKVTDTSGVGFSTFDSWQLILHGTGQNLFADAAKWTNSFDLSHSWTVAQYVRTVGDVNGDGRDDAVGFGLDGVYVALSPSTGDGFGPISRWTNSFDLSHGWTVKDYARTVGDVNGDSLDDLVGFGLDGVYVATSTGIGFDPISRWTTSFDLSHGWTVKDFVRTVGDVNGDGRADLVGFGLDGVYVATSTGIGFDPISRWTTSFDLSHGWTVKDFVRTVGDVNGDGLADLVGFGLDGVYVATSTGTGFDPISRWTNSFDLSHGWTVSQYARTVGDVNGDGRADLVGFGLDGVYVTISTGTGFDPISRWTNSFDLSHGWTVKDFARTVGDVSGDGVADLVGFGLDGVYVGIAQ